MANILILSGGKSFLESQLPPAAANHRISVLPDHADERTRQTAMASAEIIVGEPTLSELENAPRLKWLQMTWAGADRYLQGGFPENILLTTASGAFGQTIAEHAIAMMMALCRRLPAYFRSGQWKPLGAEKQIFGSTALVFGAGDIGSNIACRLEGLGVSVVGVCRDTAKARPGFCSLITMEAAEAYLSKVDFLFGALPHTAETAGYLNDHRLRKLKHDAVIVNVGRGSWIQTDALCRILDEGKLFGVGLDVVDPEPLPPDHMLTCYERVIITPHVAGVSFGYLKDTEQRIWDIFWNNLERYSHGKPLRNQVIFP